MSSVLLDECTAHMQARDEAFQNALYDFGLACGLGFEKRMPSNQMDPILLTPLGYDINNLPPVIKLPGNANDIYTGRGLCAVASSAMEVAFRQLFGAKYPSFTSTAMVFRIWTTDMDEPEIPVDSRQVRHHKIYSIYDRVSEESVAFDGTYAQLDSEFAARKTLITRDLGSYYTHRKLNPRRVPGIQAWTSLDPLTEHNQLLVFLRNGEHYSGATEQHYTRIIQALIGN